MKIKTLNRFLSWSLLIIVVAFFLLTAFSTLDMPGGIKLFSVQSGSMEPNIPLGSVVIVKASDNYDIGDVITVNENLNNSISVTHRIVDIQDQQGQLSFITKGDANEANDMDSRYFEDIIGKVIFHIPLLGYPVSFARTGLGLVLMVIVPATLIIFGEINNIKTELQRLISAKGQTKKDDTK